MVWVAVPGNASACAIYPAQYPHSKSSRSLLPGLASTLECSNKPKALVIKVIMLFIQTSHVRRACNLAKLGLSVCQKGLRC